MNDLCVNYVPRESSTRLLQCYVFCSFLLLYQYYVLLFLLHLIFLFSFLLYYFTYVCIVSIYYLYLVARFGVSSRGPSGWDNSAQSIHNRNVGFDKIYRMDSILSYRPYLPAALYDLMSHVSLLEIRQ